MVETHQPSQMPTRLHAVRKRPRFQMGRTVIALMLREMSTTYGRSAGGYFWAILDPVLGIALLSLAFSIALQTPLLGTNFPLFYASGYLPFGMTLALINKIAASVRFSRAFMGYPCVTFMDAVMARLLLNGLTDLVVTAVVLLGIMLFYGLPLWADPGAIATSVGLTVLLAAGIGTLNCYLITAFPVYEQMWMIATRPLFLISGIFFTLGSMPYSVQTVLWYNPLIHIVGLMRRGLYPTYKGDYISITYVVVLSCVTLFFGLLLLSRHFKRLMED